MPLWLLYYILKREENLNFKSTVGKLKRGLNRFTGNVVSNGSVFVFNYSDSCVTDKMESKHVNVCKMLFRTATYNCSVL